MTSAGTAEAGWLFSYGVGLQSTVGDRIVIEDAIAVLSEFLDGHRHVGVAASRLLDADGSDQWAGGRRLPSPASLVLGWRSALARLFPEAGFLDHYYCREQRLSGGPYSSDWVSAGALLVRGGLFHTVTGPCEAA